MDLKNILPGKKTLIGAILFFVGGGLIQLGFIDVGQWLLSIGGALGFLGIRYKK